MHSAVVRGPKRGRKKVDERAEDVQCGKQTERYRGLSRNFFLSGSAPKRHHFWGADQFFLTELGKQVGLRGAVGPMALCSLKIFFVELFYINTSIF